MRRQQIKHIIRIGHILFDILLCLFLFGFFLTQCGGASVVSHVNWEYHIPDKYEGYLGIQYDCPGGVPFPRRRDIFVQTTIMVPYTDAGTFCTSEHAFSWSGQESAYTRSGTLIPIGPAYKTGYGLCCGGRISKTFGAGPDSPEITVDYIWVGDVGSFQFFRNHPDQWPTDLKYNLGNFLRSRLGL